MYDLAIINGKVYLDSHFRKTNVYVKDGIIASVSPLALKATEIYDCAGDLVLPGIIDPHTHFHLELPSITSRDDFFTGTRSALFGGVTTVIDFLRPVHSAVELKDAHETRLREAANSMTDYTFHACVANPKGEVDAIADQMHALGLKTVKLFTTYSDSDRRTYDDEILALLERSKTDGFTVLAHIEDDRQINLDPTFTYRDLERSRPRTSETDEALKLAAFARGTGGRLYMVHLSSGKTLLALKENFPDVLHKQFFVESCPHYMVFDNSVWDKPDGWLYTMAPPLRPRDDVKQLQRLIADVDAIGTDHCSFNRKDKHTSLLKDMPLGIAGVEFSFPVMYSLFGDAIIDKMTSQVAKCHHLYPRKGVIREGSDADLFVYHLGASKITDHHGATDHNLYANFPTKGKVVSTIVRGRFALCNGMLQEHRGQYVNRGGIRS